MVTRYRGQELSYLLTNTAAVHITYQQKRGLGTVINPTIYPVALDTKNRPVAFTEHPYTPKDIKGKPEPLYRPVNRPYQPLADQGGEWWLITYRHKPLTPQDRMPPVGSILLEDRFWQDDNPKGLEDLYDMKKFDLLANGGLAVIPAVNLYLRGAKHTNALMPLFEDGSLPESLPERKHTATSVQLLTEATRINLKKR